MHIKRLSRGLVWSMFVSMARGERCVEEKINLPLLLLSVLSLAIHNMVRSLTIAVSLWVIGCIRAGAIAKRPLWNDSYTPFLIYHPDCAGNESNILDCPYSTEDSSPPSCRTNSEYDATSVICIPGK